MELVKYSCDLCKFVVVCLACECWSALKIIQVCLTAFSLILSLKPLTEARHAESAVQDGLNLTRSI